MPLVRVKLENGTETSVGAAFAESHGLTVLDKPAIDAVGRTLRPKPAVDLRGKALDAALDDAGLPKTGTAAEKRERLAEHNQTTDAISVGEPNPGGESTTSQGGLE